MVIESFKDAYQLFSDIWAPIVETCINLGGSILFGSLWGLNGVLLGVNLSLILIVLFWKPYYTFRYGMKTSVVPYFTQYALHLIVLIGGGLIAKFVMKLISYDESDLIATGIAIVLGMSVYIITTYIILLLCTKGMRMFTIRIKNLIRH